MATEEYSIGYEAGYQDGWNAAIDEKPKQEQRSVSEHVGEPVALYKNTPTFYVRDVNGVYIEDNPLNYYTTPQQPMWVGLTDEEIEMIESGIGYMGKSVTAIIKEAVAKLKEKNT